jgi:hypothetical protein
MIWQGNCDDAPDQGRQELEEPGKSETAEFDSIPIKQLPRQIQ